MDVGPITVLYGASARYEFGMSTLVPGAAAAGQVPGLPAEPLPRGPSRPALRAGQQDAAAPQVNVSARMTRRISRAARPGEGPTS